MINYSNTFESNHS